MIPPGSANVSIGQDGAVTYIDENPASPTYQQQVTAGYLSLAQFPNQAGLERLGGSLWAQTANSGAPIVGTPATRAASAPRSAASSRCQTSTWPAR